MNFVPTNGYIHIRRKAETVPSNDNSPIWVPDELSKNEIFIIVDDLGKDRDANKIVVDGRMIEHFMLDGKKVEFIKEHFVVGRLQNDATDGSDDIPF